MNIHIFSMVSATSGISYVLYGLCNIWYIICSIWSPQHLVYHIFYMVSISTGISYILYGFHINWYIIYSIWSPYDLDIEVIFWRVKWYVYLHVFIHPNRLKYVYTCKYCTCRSQINEGSVRAFPRLDSIPCIERRNKKDTNDLRVIWQLLTFTIKSTSYPLTQTPLCLSSV